MPSKAVEGETPSEVRWNLLPLKIGDIVEQKSLRPTYFISTHATFLEGIRHLAQGDRQRLMIVDRDLGGNIVEQTEPENTVIGILTVADVLRFLAQNIMWIKNEEIFQKTILELGLGVKKPQTVLKTTPAWKGFFEMYECGQDGLAVVDAEEKLVAHLSAYDIRHSGHHPSEFPNPPPPH